MNEKMIISQIPTIEDEIWKECIQINEWDSTREAYISSKGRLYLRANRDKSFTLKDSFAKRAGYCVINIESKSFYIHQLVAKNFIENPNNYNVINHKDEIKHHNYDNNLEWCTHAYNSRYTHNKKVARYNLNGELIDTFESAIIAAKSINANSSQLAKACRTENATVKNYFFRYYKDKPLSDIISFVFSCDKLISSYDNNGNIIKSYRSLTEASQDTNIFISSISSAIRQINPKAGGIIFAYGNEPNIIITRTDKRYSKIVKYHCDRFIKIYDSINDAAKEHNNGYQNISACCKNKIKNAYGFQWKYYENNMENYNTYSEYLKSIENVTK